MRLLLLMVAILLVATGCFDADVAVRIDSDRSGEISVAVLFNAADLDAANITDSGMKDLAESVASQVKGVDVESIRAAGERGVKLTIPFDDYHQISQVLSDAATGGQPFEALPAFDVNEGPQDRWSMRAVVDPGRLQDTLRRIPAIASVGGVGSGQVKLRVSVSLPGVVTQANSDQIDGGTATWDLKSSDTAQTLSMRTEPATISLLQWALIGAGGLIVLGLILVFATAAGKRHRRRRRGRRVKVDTSQAQEWQPTEPAPTFLAPEAWSSAPPYSSHRREETVPVAVAPPPGPSGGSFSSSTGEQPGPTAPISGETLEPPVVPPPLVPPPLLPVVPAQTPLAQPPPFQPPVPPVPVVPPVAPQPPPSQSPPGPPPVVQPPVPPVPAVPPVAPQPPPSPPPPIAPPAVAPQPVVPPAAAPSPASAPQWQSRVDDDPNRVGPPVLPAGFVPTPDNAFPETHSYSEDRPPVQPVLYDPTSVAAVPPPFNVDSGGRDGAPLPEGFVPVPGGAFPESGHSGGPPPSGQPSTAKAEPSRGLFDKPDDVEL